MFFGFTVAYSRNLVGLHTLTHLIDEPRLCIRQTSDGKIRETKGTTLTVKQQTNRYYDNKSLATKMP